jgi:hypothetical protein
MAVTFLDGLTVSGASTFSSALTLSTIANASSDTDKFLVSDSGVIKYRTGAEVRSDIGAGTGNGTVTSVASGDGLSGGTITGSGTLTVDSTVVRTTGTQTIGGAKTFSSALTLSSIAAAEELTSALFEESGVVKKQNLGTNAFTSTTIPTNNNQLTNGAGYITSLSGAVLTSGNQTVSGVKTFDEEEGGIIASYASTDGSIGITTTVGVKNASQSQNLTLTIKDGIVTGVSSDRRLKTNITLIGTSDSGINIYTFEYKYKFSIEGVGLFQGVMSDEVPMDAVSVDTHGFDVVDYSLIDVEFKRVSI